MSARAAPRIVSGVSALVHWTTSAARAVRNGAGAAKAWLNRGGTNGSLDPSYFSEASWHDRARAWAESDPSGAFWSANAADFRRRLQQAGGAHAVVNCGAHTLLRLLRNERYKNTYQLAEAQNQETYTLIGGQPKQVDDKRVRVDELFGLGAPRHPREFFFAAASMEGSGVRYYGEYCMVLRDEPPAQTQIVDRDSYEVFDEPLASFADHDRLVRMLKGTWGRDLADIAVMKIRRALERDERITTSTLQARALLEGEEFIEVHLHMPGDEATAGFAMNAVKEVRQDSRDVATDERIRTIIDAGNRARIEDVVFTRRRSWIERQFAEQAILSRVVREERTS